MWSPELTRGLAATGVLLGYAALCAAVALGQCRTRRHARQQAAALRPAAAGEPEVIVAHASQTGTAEQLAWQTARALHTAGTPARVLALSQLDAQTLRQAQRALFIVSTYGEGDPPDAAVPFARRAMADAQLSLANLHCAVLALGDREYRHYCGFGRTLDGWLRERGAGTLFERVEVDNGAPEALLRWRQQVGRLAGTGDLPGWEDAPAPLPWRLAARRLLNPGRAGGPCFHVELEPPAGSAPDWQSGDLVQVFAPADPERAREYSIASLPSDGRVHLLVRQERHADGRLGVASGWLTVQAAIGDAVSLRLRAHPNFRLGDNARRPLILIGNGTGLAGLRAHLKARAAANAGPNWLLFGERNAAHDSYFRDEIDAWRTQGVLGAIDLVFSRDQPEKRYVQERLRELAEQLREWVGRGAAIYVCGSLEGMAAGVEAALVEILGREGLDALIEQGRLRRDVY